MISVIVPIYKVEAYLDRCIRSIISQTYQDIEIILIDDGSPDRCGEICEQWRAKDSRIRLIHQCNSGLSGARNAGLEICQGEYICFADSDDELDPNMINILYKSIQNGKYDIALCNHKKLHENEKAEYFKSEKIEKSELTTTELWDEIFGRLNNAVWNKMYKHHLIGNIRFPTGLIHGEDLLFNLQYISKCNKGIKVDAPLYYYYIRSGSITKTTFNERKLDEIKIKDSAMKIIQRMQPIQLENARKYCFRARMNVLRSIYCSGSEKAYSKEVSDCQEYVKKNYPKVVKKLRLKEKIEYYMLQSVPLIYSSIAKIRYNRYTSK